MTSLRQFLLPGLASAFIVIPSVTTATPVTFSPALPIGDYLNPDISYGVDPKVASDGNGAVVSIWEANGIMFAKSSDFGATWTDPAPLAPSYSAGTGVRSHEVLYAGQGRWMAYWQGPESKVYSISDDNGFTWSTPQEMSGSIAAGSGDGTIVQYSGTPGTTSGHFMYRLPRHTLTWEQPFELTPAPVGVLRTIVNSSGPNWFMLSGSTDGVVYTSTDDGVTWASTVGTNVPRTARFDRDESGTITAVYAVNNDLTGPFSIFVSRSTDNGVNWSQPIEIAESVGLFSITFAVDFVWGDIAYAGNGNWIIMWITPTGTEYSLSTDGGITWNAPVSLPSFSSDLYWPNPAVTADQNQIVWVWPGSEIREDEPSANSGIFYSYGVIDSTPPVVEPPAGPAPNFTGVWSPADNKCKTNKKGITKCKIKAKFLTCNAGNDKPGSKSVIRIYLSEDDVLDMTDVEISTKKLPKIKPGKGKTTKIKLKTTESLTGMRLIAVIDPDQAVAELDETDNIVVSDPLP